MLYGDNKPSEDAIDRVVGKINEECVQLVHHQLPFMLLIKSTSTSIDKKGKFSRKRLNEDEGDITYINERNRVFNKKVRFSFYSRIALTNECSTRRLHGITISILQRSGQASSVVQHFSELETTLLCLCFLYIVGRIFRRSNHVLLYDSTYNLCMITGTKTLDSTQYLDAKNVFI